MITDDLFKSVKYPPILNSTFLTLCLLDPEELSLIPIDPPSILYHEHSTNRGNKLRQERCLYSLDKIKHKQERVRAYKIHCSESRQLEVDGRYTVRFIDDNCAFYCYSGISDVTITFHGTSHVPRTL